MTKERGSSYRHQAAPSILCLIVLYLNSRNDTTGLTISIKQGLYILIDSTNTGKMKLGLVVVSLFVSSPAGYTTWAFAPSLYTSTRSTSHSISKTSTRKMMMMMDPSHFHDLISLLPTSLLAADADTVTASTNALVDTVVSNTAAATATATDATAAAVDPNAGNGGFGFLTEPIQFLLTTFHSVLVSLGMSADAWGVSIMTMTLFIKLLTYPLTKSQLESTTKMQSLQPTIKEIQSKYQSNPEVMNQKIAEVYQTNQINPLAGCIPALVQIPIFIGLYRAVLNLAKEDRLDERFLWLPNLEGPIYGADPAHGSDWLLKNWNNGIPPLGWEDTLAFLSLPVILIVSQYVSMALMTPTMNKDQEQPAILKFLPLMVGWFSLNVPAALGIYWVVNNVVTTLLTLQIRSSLASATTTGGSGGSATIVDVEPIKFTPAPIREKPVGFRTETSKKGEGDMKMITSPTDESDDDEEDGEDTVESSTTDSDGAKSKKRGGKKKRKN